MRTAQMKRATRETDIALELDLDAGDYQIETGVGFFDHMLTSFAVHSGFGLRVHAKGDYQVDDHHTVEDVGIVLGQAFHAALGEKRGIRRFASAYIPMDEALAFCAVDVSGRPFLRFDAPMPQEKIGSFDACLTEEFMRAFAMNAGATIHLKAEYSVNAHHITEALFKALARALHDAVAIVGSEIPSSKGAL